MRKSAINLTVRNYEELENCFVRDDYGNVIYVGKHLDEFVVSDEYLGSNEWIEFENGTTIFRNSSGSVYVSKLTLREELENYIDECESGCSYRIWNEDIANGVITYINPNLEQIISIGEHGEELVSSVCSYIEDGDTLEKALVDDGKCWYRLSFGLWANADDCKELDKKAYLESDEIVKANQQ